MQRKVERLQKEREAEKPRRGRWKGDGAGTRTWQLQVALPCLACLPLSQHGPGVGRAMAITRRERRKRAAVLGGPGAGGRPRGPAQPVVGWKARELPGGRKGRVVRPKNDQRAAAPAIDSASCPSSHGQRGNHQGLADGDGSAEKVGTCLRRRR